MSRSRINLHAILNSIFWVCMYLFWLGFNQPAMPSLPVNIFFTLVDFICFLSIALVTSYLLIPKFLYKRKYLKFALSYFAILCCITTIMVYLNYLILKPYRSSQDYQPFSFEIKDLAGSYLLAFFLSSASSIFKLVNDFYKNQSTITRLNEEKLKSELELLKIQVNPHSFFNILNTIYFQIDQDKEAAKKCVLLFSKMFRYQLYECDSETVSLDKEIEFLNNYIQISKTRYDPDYEINFEVKKNGNPSIAPFLLFPLVENSFKHVSQHINKPNAINVLVDYTDKELNCSITNTADMVATNGKGIGLKNLNRRLELLYKGRYKLVSHHEKGIYQTQLSISL